MHAYIHTYIHFLLVALTKQLKNRDKFWRKDSFWTSGLSARATPLKQQGLGQNVLGELLVKKSKTGDHTYA